MRRISLLALALIATAVAVPAQAASDKSAPHKCQPHTVGYVVGGTLVSSTLTLDAAPAKTYSGTLIVLVTKTNKHAKADKGLTKTYTLSHATVSFSVDVNTTSPAAGSRIHLQGTITALEPKCSQTGFTPAVTITKVEIHRAKTPKP